MGEQRLELDNLDQQFSVSHRFLLFIDEISL